jgi:hypothetical protein
MCEMCKDCLSDPYPLSGGRIARIRLGLQPPKDGDHVVARGYVLLPARGRQILPDIQFGERLSVMGHALCDWWGLGKSLLPPQFPRPEGEWKFNVVEFHAPTWREAMTAAWEYAHSELMKLEDALAQRQRALEEAECPDNGEPTAGKGKRRIQIGRGNDDHKDQ